MKDVLVVIGITILALVGVTVVVPVIIYPLNYVSCKVDAEARNVKNWNTSLNECYFELDGKMINADNYDKVVFGNTLNIK